MKLSILVTEMLCSIYTEFTKVTFNVVHPMCTTLSPACLCLQRLFMLIKEDLCRIFPVMISLRGLLYVTVRYSFVHSYLYSMLIKTTRHFKLSGTLRFC